jgi:hypothetical protein
MAGAIGVPHTALTSGTDARSTILESYVFASGIHEPEISNILSYKYPQYYLTALLDRIDGGSEEISQNVWSWFEMDRTRKGGTVTYATGAISTSTLTIETGYAWDAGAQLGYLVVGDVIRFHTGATGRVTSSVAGTEDSTKQKITVEHIDGRTWTADETAGTGIGTGTTGVFGHVFNAQAEASDAPNGRTYLPEEKYNFTTILRRSFKVSGTEATNRTYIGDGGAWFFEIENIEMKELARDKEGLVMFGSSYKGSSTTGDVKTGAGLWELALANGVKTNFAAATGVTETDIQDTLQDLMVVGGSSNRLGLCGSQIHLDAQRALRDYHVAGSINYGGFGGNEVGLDVQSYRIGGQTLDLVHYALFDDTAMVPTPATVSSTATDFKNAMILLDMGTDDKGKKLISLKYKGLNGSSRKFIHAYEDGLMSADGNNGGKVANGGDYFSIHYLIECGLECRVPERLGIIRATS